MQGGAKCRCGASLTIPPVGDRMECSQCGAKIRLKRDNVSSQDYIRFHCMCGRRLKVSAIDPPDNGVCPDCGEVVPVPQCTPDMPTRELSSQDQAALRAWIAKHQSGSKPVELTKHPTEAGLRVCPACGSPVHVAAVSCRSCGAAVPKR